MFLRVGFGFEFGLYLKKTNGSTSSLSKGIERDRSDILGVLYANEWTIWIFSWIEWWDWGISNVVVPHHSMVFYDD